MYNNNNDMEQFSLDEYLADTTKRVVTREGKDVRIICTDRDSLFPVVFLIRKETGATESVFAANENGICSIGVELCDYDLFFAPKKQSRWVYLCGGIHMDGAHWEVVSQAFASKEVAKENMERDGGFALTEITWEE